mmetsp:Transcript_32818/g.79480  ORF Transcript_32818/g.79480 Transcript_32818/m.79480 type:complete len:286 (+) Transcript_32818:50-907(+)
MPSIFKKLSSKSKSTGTSKKSGKSSIFRVKKSIDPPTTTEKQPLELEHPCLTWTSSVDSGESPVIAPSFSNPSDGSVQSDIESLKQDHSEEVERLAAAISQLEKANETLKMEKETTEQVMLQQESEILQQNSEIHSLSDTLAKAAKVNEESSIANTTPTKTILPEDIFGNEYQRKYEAAQTIIYRQEIDIVTKAEEISYLQSALRAQELQHDAQRKLLLSKVLEREQEIESLNEKLTVTSQLVSQTASMLLKHNTGEPQRRRNNTATTSYFEYWSGGSNNHTKTV